MSESKPWDLWEVILEETDSKWVRWEDYARLKAEVERLELEVFAFDRTINQASCHYDNRLEDIRQLQAQVERLTKAGDAMADLIAFNSENIVRGEGEDVHPSVIRWDAAKEGNQP
jgi:hypothetical protein